VKLDLHSAPPRIACHTAWHRLFIAAAIAVAALSIGAIALAAPAPAWTTLAPVPNGGAEGMFGGIVGNQVIAAYGDQSGFGDSNLTRIYNIASDTWTMGSDAPGDPRAEGTAVTNDGILYALGGRSFTALPDLDAYNVATDMWTTLAPMNTARAGLAAAVVDDSIYAIGGRVSGGGPCSGGPLDAVERYDIATNSWTTVASLPIPLSDAAAVASDDEIYVFGGCTGDDFPETTVNTVYVYNVDTNTWSTAAPMPRARAGFYQVGEQGNSVYVMGGLDSFFDTAADPNVDIYNMALDTWTTSDVPMPQPRGEMVVASHGGRIYTVGGSLPAFGNTTDTNAVLKP